jgi:hypothetical protein
MCTPGSNTHAFTCKHQVVGQTEHLSSQSSAAISSRLMIPRVLPCTTRVLSVQGFEGGPCGGHHRRTCKPFRAGCARVLPRTLHSFGTPTAPYEPYFRLEERQFTWGIREAEDRLFVLQKHPANLKEVNQAVVTLRPCANHPLPLRTSKSSSWPRGRVRCQSPKTTDVQASHTLPHCPQGSVRFPASFLPLCHPAH